MTQSECNQGRDTTQLFCPCVLGYTAIFLPFHRCFTELNYNEEHVKQSVWDSVNLCVDAFPFVDLLLSLSSRPTGMDRTRRQRTLTCLS